MTVSASRSLLLSTLMMFGLGAAATATPITVQFYESTTAVSEAAGNLELAVTLDRPAEAAQTIKFKITPGTAALADITTTTASVTIPVGESEGVITIGIKQDTLDENDEVFYVDIVETTAVMRGTNAICEVTIVDDDERVELIYGPVSEIVARGDRFDLYADATGSDLKFQWLKNGAAIAGATDRYYLIPDVQLSHAGAYSVKISNALNSVTSAKAELAVVDTSDRWVPVLSKGTVTLTAPAAGTAGTLSYQWLFFDGWWGREINGATTKTLTISNVTEEEVGDYYCIVNHALSGGSPRSGYFSVRIVTGAPRIEPVDLPSGQVLRHYSFQVLCDEEWERSPGKFSASGLPKGLAIDPNTGLISGVPLAPVTNAKITITATNPAGKGTAMGFLTIDPFPQGALGTFHGIVDRVDGDPADTWERADIGARLEIVTTTSGAYTGKLLNGTTLPFKGQLIYSGDNGLVSSTQVPVLEKGGRPLILDLALDPETDTLTGTLSEQDTVIIVLPGPTPKVHAAIHGWRNVWTKTHPATAWVARYNFLIGLFDYIPGLGEGTGYGSFTPKAFGTFDISGRLPDSTPFICNTFLGPQGQLLLYQPLYAQPGSVHGVIGIGEADEVKTWELHRDSGSVLNCTWNKPPQTVASDKLYHDGFPVSLIGVSGGRYVPPEPGAIVVDLNDVEMNADLSFSYPGGPSAEFVFTIPPTGVPVLPSGAANPLNVSFTLNPATGEFSGNCTFHDPDPQRPPAYDDLGNLTDPGGFFNRTGNFYGLIARSPLYGSDEARAVLITREPVDPMAEPPITEANAQLLAGGVYLYPNPNAADPVVVELSANELTVDEDDVTWQFPVRLSRPFAESRSIPIKVVHGQTTDADFQISTTNLFFAVGETEQSFNLTFKEDVLDEDDEQFTLSLVDGAGYNLGQTTNCGITIIDDDTAAAILSQPTSRIVGLYSEAGMTVDIAGTDPVWIQWRKDNMRLDDQTNLAMRIGYTRLSDAGAYDVVVTNPVGSVTSVKANLVVVDTNSYMVPVARRSSIRFTARVSGPSSGLRYQWMKNGVVPLKSGLRVHGATMKSLLIGDYTEKDDGDYTCVVTQTETGASVTTGSFYPTLITGKPELPPLPNQTGAVGSEFTYVPPEVEWNSERLPAFYSATGLPAGLIINRDTGYISGIPREAVTNRVFTVTATNPLGSVSSSALITIAPLAPELVGTFQGLVTRGLLVPPGNLYGWDDAYLGGRIEVTTTAGGSYTGKVTCGYTTHPFSGSLNVDADYAASVIFVPRSSGPALRLTLEFWPNVCGGYLWLDSPSFEPLTFYGWRNVWSAAHPASPFTGLYNFSIKPQATEPYQEMPRGIGYGACSIPASGTFDIKGRLPDGSTFVSSSFLGPEGQLLIYQPLYTVPGSFMADLAIQPRPSGASNAIAIAEGGSASLLKPWQGTATDRSYPQGIYNPSDSLYALNLEIFGARYAPPVPGAIVLGLPDKADNALILFREGGLEGRTIGPDVVFRMGTGGTVTMPANGANPCGVSLTMNPTTGEFNGAFTLSDPDPYDSAKSLTRRSDFSGLIAEDVDGVLRALGFFALPQLPDPLGDPSTTATTSPVLTGWLELFAAPP